MDSMEEMGLDEDIIANLRKESIVKLFPVQLCLIPTLLRNNKYDCMIPQDICISAPTGSGKTLAYVIPIIQTLKRRSIIRLRALVLLPSRELANQVYKVFSYVSSGTGIKIGLSTGQNSFEEDRRDIVGELPVPSYQTSIFSNEHLHNTPTGSQGTSLVDILVCTPSRLQDHIQYSPGFTLKHLRFLVLDEADRLLGNAYHSWVRAIVRTSHTGGSAHGGGRVPSGTRLQRLLFSATMTDNPRKLALLEIHNPLIIRVGASDIKSDRRGNKRVREVESVLEVMDEATHDAETYEDDDDNNDDDISNIHNKYESVSDELANEPVADIPETEDAAAAVGDAPADGEQRFVLPLSLQEYTIDCDTVDRPRHILSLLWGALGLRGGHRWGDQPVSVPPLGTCIVFASSLEATHRLCRLLQLVNRQHERTEGLIFGGKVAEMSRSIDRSNRVRTMEEASAGIIRVLVATDHMARGIDLPNVALVINYDPPTQAATYVHRVGRTARANRCGVAVTLVRTGQRALFKRMRDEIGGGGVMRLELSDHEGRDELLTAYKVALRELPQVVAAEQDGRISCVDDLMSMELQ